MFKKTKLLLGVTTFVLLVISIELILIYLYPSIVELHYILALSLGVGTIIILRYAYGVPYPHDYGKLKNPDVHGYLSLINDLKEGDRLDIVMGEVNPDVVSADVDTRLRGRIEELNDFRLRLIVGPKVHGESRHFLETLFSFPDKVQIYKKYTRPVRHFRLLHNRELVLEPPHKEFIKSKYWKFLNSYYLDRRYRETFKDYLEDSKPCSGIEDLVFGAPSE